MRRAVAGARASLFVALELVAACDRPRPAPLARGLPEQPLAREAMLAPSGADAALTGPRCAVAPGRDASGPSLATDGAPRAEAEGRGDLPPDVAASDVEVGDAVACLRGPLRYAVGAVDHRGRERTARLLVAVAPDDVGAEAGGFHDSTPSWRPIDLGATLGDAPPPRAACVEGGALLAAAYGLGAALPHEDARELVVYSVRNSGPAEPRWTVPQARDDSLAFDVAPSGAGLVLVWDEALPGLSPHPPSCTGSPHTAGVSTGVERSASAAGSVATGGPRGVIRGLRLPAGPVHDVSPPESDAELPRLVTSSVGLTALWIARSPEPAPVRPDPNGGEVPGEARSYAWLEAVSLDAAGSPRPPVVRLTPATGHLSSYDATALGDGSLLVVARDAGEAVDGSGGTLLRVRVQPGSDRVSAPLAFPTDGLGGGAPALVLDRAGRVAWLSWVGADEQVRLMPLDADGAPAGPASSEPALSGARALMVLTGSDAVVGARERILVARPGHAEAPLEGLSCSRAPLP